MRRAAAGVLCRAKRKIKCRLLWTSAAASGIISAREAAARRCERMIHMAYSEKLASQTAAYLKSQNWQYEFNEADGIFRFGMNLDSRVHSCRVTILVEEHSFTAYAICPIRVDAEHLPAVANYLTRANFGMKLGNFELDYRDGEIRFKSSLFCGGAVPPLDVMERVVDVSFMMLQAYGDGLLNVIFAEADPAQEIAKIED